MLFELSMEQNDDAFIDFWYNYVDQEQIGIIIAWYCPKVLPWHHVQKSLVDK